jgi:TolB-like protein
MNPRESITQFMADSLRSQLLFKDVEANERGIEPAYVLTGRIEQLGELDRKRDVLAECAISAELVEVHTGTVLWSDRASETLPLKNRDVAGVVSGITAAAQIAVDRLVKSLAKSLESVR